MEIIALILICLLPFVFIFGFQILFREITKPDDGKDR